MRRSDGLQAEECTYKKINSGIWMKKYKRWVESPISWEWKTFGVCRASLKHTIFSCLVVQEVEYSDR